MNVSRIMGLVVALALAAFIWLRHRSAWGADTIPALAAFPLFFWLGRPWRWREIASRPATWQLAGGAGLWLAGSVLDVTALLALGWCLGFLAWLKSQTEPAVPVRLAVVLFCGFPWITLDGQALGWWFRFSGAAAAEWFFSGLGLAVVREGTFLRVQGLPLSVDAACSGLNVLQAMLLAGAGLAYLLLRGRRFWVGVALLLPLAWLANTARIIALGLIGLSFGAEAAMGWFHAWGGWSILCAMFLFCWACFHALAARAPRAL